MSSANLQKNKDQCMEKNLEQLTPKSLRQVIEIKFSVAQHLHSTHYTHHQVSLIVSRNTTLVPSLGLRIGPACEAGLSAGM